jgi:hypothetical protein
MSLTIEEANKDWENGPTYHLVEWEDSERDYLCSYGKEKPTFTYPTLHNGLAENYLPDIPDGEVDLLIDEGNALSDRSPYPCVSPPLVIVLRYVWIIERATQPRDTEMLLLEETAREVGKQNMSKGGQGMQNFADLDENWRQDVADRVGVSHETVRKGTDVYRFAYPDQFVHDNLQL